ncbi:uncharacterized protein [Branchiostoma lanceolatum]|uniref:uncharacterized protein n=1 Tax=Branchiostoma lanceolatum TaxID=7740 RepID=UPI0034520122
MRVLLVLPLLLTAVVATDFFHQVMPGDKCAHQEMTYGNGDQWHWDKYPAEDVCAFCECISPISEGHVGIVCRKTTPPPALPGCQIYQNPEDCSNFPMVCPNMDINTDLDTSLLIGPL